MYHVKRCNHLDGGGKSWLLCFSLACWLCTVSLDLFTLSLGVIGRLSSVIMTLPVSVALFFFFFFF